MRDARLFRTASFDAAAQKLASEIRLNRFGQYGVLKKLALIDFSPAFLTMKGPIYSNSALYGHVLRREWPV
ncbi:hypothetical protein [Yoonia sp.]|uniref:hypothetical protein n=1 Tax=Yoonia sp. TaxID=2212373 RepID=UPI003975582A